MKFTKQTKQVVILYASTLSGVLLGVVASIINTRFLSPADYGDVRYVQNIINFIASLLLFGYFLSGSRLLALSNNELRSRTIRGTMLLILIMACIVLSLSMLVCYFAHSPANPAIAQLFLISIPVCYYPLLLNYINTVSQGDNHIGRLSIARLLPTLLYILTAVFVYQQWGADPESVISIQWGIYSAVLLIIILSAHPKISNVKHIFTELNDENHKYGLQLYIGSLFMVASNYLAGITLGVFNEDNTEVGFYTLALTVTTPLSTLPAIIGTTYFKQFAPQPRIPSKVLKNSILLTVGTCILFILLIKPLIAFLYSEEYHSVGNYAVWLAAGFSIHGFGDMINRYLGSHGQGKAIRNSSIANGVFKIFGYTTFVYLFNTEGALLTNVLCSIIYCTTLIYYYQKFISVQNG